MENKELTEVEVNLYISDCGSIMKDCLTDCYILGAGWTPFLSRME